MTDLERLAGRPVVLSVSGGKDSAATSLYLRELGIEHVRVFADTGWENQKTYDYLRGELARVLGPIQEVRGPLTLPELVRKKGMFASRNRRFCTTDLKIKPLAQFVKRLADELGEVVNAVGIRNAESEARSKLPAWEYSETFEADVWRPIVTWSEADVIAIHKRHGLSPNPLYLEGASRVGCWPCLMSNKEELRHLFEVDPGRVDEIRALEAEVLEAADARYTAKGTSREALGYHAPTFFQAAMPDTPGGKRGRWPIDTVVAWAKTSRGGRQLEVFSDPSDGCARWGMCEGSKK